MVGLLQAKGADRAARDAAGHTPDYYLDKEFVPVKAEEEKVEKVEAAEVTGGEAEPSSEETEKKVVLPTSPPLSQPLPTPSNPFRPPQLLREMSRNLRRRRMRPLLLKCK